MNVQHFEKGLHYSDREFLLLAKKIGRLATYCERLKDEASWIRIDADRRPTEKAQDRIKVTITVELPKAAFRVESRRSTALRAIDRCIEKLEPQIKRYKEMHTGKGRARTHYMRARKKRAA
ncbi:HPF/RaiA family ribosome-associated protein [Candidatus Peregrinibacteria bacterium]|nr:HPF/RaiA family ribosome-associated protein [Candidatus Peregrinibacteria bacterium]